MNNGTVERVTSRGKAFNAKISGEWYGLGFDKPECDEGDEVSFDVVMSKDGRFKNAQNVTIVKKGAGASAARTASAPSGGYRNDNVQRAIQRQASRNAAIAVVAAALQANAVKLPAAANRQLDAILAYVDEIADRYDEDTQAAITGDKKAEKESHDELED